MRKLTIETRSLYRITHRERGSVHLVPAETAQDACGSLGWLIGECHIIEVPKQRHPTRLNDPGVYVKLECATCPYQRAECIKPANLTCPVRSDVPDIAEWIDKVLQAHLCDHVGVDLTINDYQGHRKWLTLAEALKELTPKP